MLDYSNLLSRIDFTYGKVVTFDDLPDNSVALDGGVQGPQLDPARRRFSFDHHAGCIRLVTKATCEQVREALCLGLPIDAETHIFINDIDADTVLSVWLLQHPERARSPHVVELVGSIGLTDAHGPVFPAHPIHGALTPKKPWMPGYVPQSMEMLNDMLGVVDQWVAGEWTIPDAEPKVPVTGWGWSPVTGWKEINTTGEGSGFGKFYQLGFVLGFLHSPAANGTVLYTVAKGSDLVSANLGPGSSVRPMTGPGDALPSILGQLALAEFAKNPNQAWAATWGGGSSIGGSPRNAVPEGEAGSVLTPLEVLAVFKRFRP